LAKVGDIFNIGLTAANLGTYGAFIQRSAPAAGNTCGIAPVTGTRVLKYSVLVNPTVVVSTFAGSGQAGSVDGVGTNASFNSPSAVTVDAQGNLYVTDTQNYKIRKITPQGVVSTFAGNGQWGNADGPAATASFSSPNALAIDTSGNLYVTDGLQIRKITPQGVVSTLADVNQLGGWFNSGNRSSFGLGGIAVDTGGNVYVIANGRVLTIAPTGTISFLAGSAPGGTSVDGVGANASFSTGYGMTVDSSGNLFVADYMTIRKITPQGVVSTIAVNGQGGSSDGVGTAATFGYVIGIASDSSGNLYVSDANNNNIRKVTSQNVVSTFAGIAGGNGSTDGLAASASFSSPRGLKVDAIGNVWVVDGQNNKIRKIAVQ
jgi:sugar lactone lactonase YvrE